MIDKKGFLALIGGNEKKTGQKLVLKKLLEIRNIDSIAVIPSASMSPKRLSRKYVDAFINLGVSKISVLDIRRNYEADSKKHLEVIDKSDLIFFTGGDQYLLYKTLAETELLSRIWNKFKSGSILAGTSAGAAVMSSPMIYDGDTKPFVKGSVLFSNGFGFLEDITIDTHFYKRHRLPRLIQFLSRGISKFGIGLPENSGIIVYPDKNVEVIGKKPITFVDCSQMEFTDINEIKKNELYSTLGIKIGYLQPGLHFSINDLSCIKMVEQKINVITA